MREDGIAEEDSLAENLQREALHPLDRFRAFVRLRERGLGEEEIAARFFVTPAVVRQRLRLAAVSPVLLEAYAADGMTLEQLMAFSVTPDQARQERVWESLAHGGSREPWQIRRRLTEAKVPACDRRARFVGVEAYAAAGGGVLRDLFAEDGGGWLDDPDLLQRLVAEKLAAIAEEVRREGWMWVEAAVELPYLRKAALRRMTGTVIEPGDDERARIEALRTEHRALLDAQGDPEALAEDVVARLDAIETELGAATEPQVIHDPWEMARGGAFVSLDADGRPRIDRGYVRPEDEPPAEPEPSAEDADAREPMDVGGAHASADPGAAETDRRPAAQPERIVSGGPSAASDDPEPEEDPAKPLSDRLLTELDIHRTMALRDALGSDPDTALLAVLHVLCLAVFYGRTTESCLEIRHVGTALPAEGPGLADFPPVRALDARHTVWARQLPGHPEALWGTLVGFDADSRAALLAHCAGWTVNAVHEPWNRGGGRTLHAERLAEALALDMAAAGWSPTVEGYLGRVPKARILAAVREAKGEEAAARIAHLRKADMAREAERLLAGSGWLPEALRTAGVPYGAAAAEREETGDAERPVPPEALAAE